MKKKQPRIFEKTVKTKKSEEPLVLKEEVKENKLSDKKESSKILSPAVRKIVVENKVNLNKVEGSGKEGRILKGDLISMMGVNPQPSERKIEYGQEERIKMTRLRQTIAKRLKQAQEKRSIANNI